MKNLCFIALIALILNFRTFANSDSAVDEIAPFMTDFCTDFPEGTLHRPNLWKNCCIKHDMAYWVAGSKKQRKQADWRLHQCVEEVGGKFYASLIYRGVLLGHHSPIKSKTRWGWAWKDRPYFQPLTSAQIDLALTKLEHSNANPHLIDEFIQESGLSHN